MTVKETDETKAETVVSHTLLQGQSVRDLHGNAPQERQRFLIPTFNPHINGWMDRWWKYGVLRQLSRISALNLRMKVELFSHPWFLPYLLWGSKAIWIMEGLQRSLVLVYLHWRSLHMKGTEWNASLLSQPTYLFWFLWVFFVNLGSFFLPVDNMVIKTMNSASQGFYCLLIMIMAFTTNTHMLLICPARQWIYFLQKAACFP